MPTRNERNTDVKLRTLQTEPPFAEVAELLRAEQVDDPALREAVSGIIRAVAEGGDTALLELIRRHDGFPSADLNTLTIASERLERAESQLEPRLRQSLRTAADNIRRFHERQLERGFVDLFADGSLLGQRVAPLQRVGVYVPGGRAAYPSSVLMNAIPAAVAGVREIVMATPAPEGKIAPAVLAAAHLAGVTEVVAAGGAHAIAALAYGTPSIARVDKITGPGNRWVAEAKRQVFGRVDIDMIAGPSEILVIADATADARQVAADLIAQAEHDPDAIAWLITTHEPLLHSVRAEVELLLRRNPRRETARAALESNGLLCHVPDLTAAAALAELRAPEHLELLVAEPLALAGRIRNAGAIFLGASTPEPVGDYLAGPNHVLPTGGTARWASPLGVYDFVKRTSLIGYSRQRLLNEADAVISLAEAEGLHGHAEAVRVRCDDTLNQERVS
jgi:histidinol dehydrogenase